MPVRPEGVYPDGRGKWYIKATIGHDALTGKRIQVTKRGYRSAADAGRARREFLGEFDRGEVRRSSTILTVNELLDLYLDGLDSDAVLSAKTRFDYRHYADDYIRTYLGQRKVRDITPEVIVAWQRRLAEGGGAKSGRALSPNTIRLARAPLAGAFKMAVAIGIVTSNPLARVPRPTARRSIPRHWSPEEARQFLTLMEGDRTYAIWAFLLGSGLRIGELVWLRWSNIDLRSQRARVVEFASTLGYKLVPSIGKSREAVRSIDLDDGLVKVLRSQHQLQVREQQTAANYAQSDYVFTKPEGGPYHPQRLSRLLESYTRALGLPPLTAHGLRHTSATLMLAQGVPPKVAAERLGHADPTLFSNLYSHVTPTMQRGAAEKIGELLFDLKLT